MNELTKITLSPDYNNDLETHQNISIIIPSIRFKKFSNNALTIHIGTPEEVSSNCYSEYHYVTPFFPFPIGQIWPKIFFIILKSEAESFYSFCSNKNYNSLY
jgi:hypothetical protein